MIFWLVQSSQDHPSLKRGQPPRGLLAKNEQEQLAALKFEKRRLDWLLGRWTSKLLIQAILQQGHGRSPALEDIIVTNDADGAPVVSFNSGGILPQVALSISHSGDLAFCAAIEISSPATNSLGILGADIERVEVRSPGFVQEYFTEKEAALVERTPIHGREILVTAIWSAKEAALKALHLGLTVDTRSVTCLVEPEVDAPQSWVPFQIEWDVPRLNRYASQGRVIPPLLGWWRNREGYVLTLTSVLSDQPCPSASQ
jgi:4'-phosphopantetheinyl transferase